MKSKQQKIKEIEQETALVDSAQSLIFVDFAKTPTKDIVSLKQALEHIESVYKVVKKRLLKIVLGKKEIPVDPKSFSAQLATVFSPKDISESAGVVYRFAKEREKDGGAFKVLGGYDVTARAFFGEQDIKRIGQLPSREVLLAQLVGMVQAPLRSLAYVLDQVAKKNA